MAEFVIAVSIGLIGICLSLLVLPLSLILSLIIPTVTAIGIFCFILDLSSNIFSYHDE